MKIRAKIISALLSVSLVFGCVNPVALAANRKNNEGEDTLTETAEAAETLQETEKIIVSESETVAENASEVETAKK